MIIYLHVLGGFYIGIREGERGIPNVYKSASVSLNKLSMDREGGVKKSQNFVYVECERPPAKNPVAGLKLARKVLRV